MAGFTYLNNSLLESYDSEGQFLQTYNTSEMLGGVAHTLKITDYFYIAETVKIFFMDYAYMNSLAASLDLAVMFKFLDMFYISLSLDNIAATRFLYNNREEPLPAMVKLAPSVHLFDDRLKIFYMMDF
jgi:hypothetical protein